ncbi:Hypothetical protein PHPALM_19194 [Phytophthora palmivora]|uniref:Uncharacterized protein n=1 Tax=Phytophthora palmivora TaxID=4796 RepID=A0A2P4XHW9_9STRA|nr:Hypothetical protein PHPALM_19194 [Phytophthora palmivora]
MQAEQTPTAKKRKRAKKKERSGRCVTPAATRYGSGRCMTPAAEQDDENEVNEESSRSKSGGLKSTSASSGSDLEKERLTASSNQVAPCNRAQKTGCREYHPVKTRSGRVSKPPKWMGDTIHLAYRDSVKEKSSGSKWGKLRDEMQLEIAKEKALD